MKWEGKRESENVEDRRGQRGGFRFPFPGRGGGFRIPGGGGFPIPGGGRQGGIGIVGIIVIVVIMLLLGVDPRVLLEGGVPQGGQVPRDMSGRDTVRDVTGLPLPRETPTGEAGQQSQRAKSFVAVVLAKTEDVWTQQFAQIGRQYQKPKLVLFERFTQSGCGTGMSQMGPFYCPLDEKVYLDLSFYRDLVNRFRAPGDFAQAYVIAHEVGHHVQTQLGVTEKVMAAKQRVSQTEANALQVRMELQADCYAGLWAHHAEKIDKTLDPGDIEEALGAATAIGDDRIQRQTHGQVVPDSFTHGSSAQRVRWFRKGFESGDMQACNTFSAPSL